MAMAAVRESPAVAMPTKPPPESTTGAPDRLAYNSRSSRINRSITPPRQVRQLWCTALMTPIVAVGPCCVRPTARAMFPGLPFAAARPGAIPSPSYFSTAMSVLPSRPANVAPAARPSGSVIRISSVLRIACSTVTMTPGFQMIPLDVARGRASMDTTDRAAVSTAAASSADKSVSALMTPLWRSHARFLNRTFGQAPPWSIGQESIAAHVSESNQIDLKDPARRWTIVVRPAGMNARVATDQLTVVHGQSMGIRGAGKEVHDFEHLAAGG